MMNETEKSSSQKKQALSIIYFFDGGRTRNIRIPLNLLKVLAGILLALVLWATFGTFLFVRTVMNANDLSAQLQKSMDTVFQYQVKQDSILETSYRVEKKPIKKEKKHETEVAAIKETVKVLPVVENSKIANLLDVKNLHIRAEQKDSFVIVESPYLRKHEKVLDVSVALRNRKTNSRAEGLIWASTEWQDAFGKTLQVSTQANANTYSIRQYKVKKFSLSVPEKFPILSKVEVWLSDRSQNKSKYEILGN